MKIKYDSEADVLLFVLRDDPPVDAIEESGGHCELWRGWRTCQCGISECVGPETYPHR